MNGMSCGTGEGTRTPKPLRALAFEANASTSSATPARQSQPRCNINATDATPWPQQTGHSAALRARQKWTLAAAFCHHRAASERFFFDTPSLAVHLPQVKLSPSLSTLRRFTPFPDSLRIGFLSRRNRCRHSRHQYERATNQESADEGCEHLLRARSGVMTRRPHKRILAPPPGCSQIRG